MLAFSFKSTENKPRRKYEMLLEGIVVKIRTEGKYKQKLLYIPKIIKSMKWGVKNMIQLKCEKAMNSTLKKNDRN